ncbi:MAG: hypothetical protein ACRDNZ_16165 [Streptosporangiaceae bacterium]
MPVHAGLAEDLSARSDAQAAVNRLAQRSQHRRPADAVALVNEARAVLSRPE